jgi:hypothetical protein
MAKWMDNLKHYELYACCIGAKLCPDYVRTGVEGTAIVLPVISTLPSSPQSSVVTEPPRLINACLRLHDVGTSSLLSVCDKDLSSLASTLHDARYEACSDFTHSFHPFRGIPLCRFPLSKGKTLVAFMKNGVFWVVTPCGSCKNRRFGRLRRLLVAACVFPSSPIFVTLIK